MPIIYKNKKIVAILTKKSKNAKTGDIAQTWILRNDMHPVDAVKTGADSAICGKCPMRGIKGKGRGCYVNLNFGVGSVYSAFKRGIYETAPIGESVGGDDILRWGSYGDPYYLPVKVVEEGCKAAKKHAGYTHQWRYKKAAPYAKFLMASVENLADKKKANDGGWRTFRVTSDLSTKTPDEVVCPASAEMGHKLTCAQCGLCNGHWNGKRRNVVIRAHGSPVSAGKHALQIAE